MTSPENAALLGLGICPGCGTTAPLAQGVCFSDAGDGLDLVPVDAVSGRSTGRVPEGPRWRPVCWNCGTAATSRLDAACPNPQCRRSLVPPALVIRFPDGQVELSRAESVELGRVGPYSELFAANPHVSRRHALVRVDGDGRGWLAPHDAVNGTFVDDREIDAETELLAGALVRFASVQSGVVGHVRAPERE